MFLDIAYVKVATMPEKIKKDKMAARGLRQVSSSVGKTMSILLCPAGGGSSGSRQKGAGGTSKDKAQALGALLDNIDHTLWDMFAQTLAKYPDREAVVSLWQPGGGKLASQEPVSGKRTLAVQNALC